jgi:hypothetical protein
MILDGLMQSCWVYHCGLYNDPVVPVSLWSLALLPGCIDEATNGAVQKAILCRTGDKVTRCVYHGGSNEGWSRSREDGCMMAPLLL